MLGLLSYYKIRNKPVPAGICLLFFGVVTVPPTTTLYFLINKHWTFQAIAFAGGVFCWTFIEYYVHRFLMHAKDDYHKSDHFLHHTNPIVIFTSQLKRIAYSFIAILFTTTSILFSNYLLLPAGIMTGFALYINMHRILHSTWAAKWFGGLQKFHMQHHLTLSEKCFGVTTTFWDRLFNTTGKENKLITTKKLKHYFDNDLKKFITHKQAV